MSEAEYFWPDTPGVYEIQCDDGDSEWWTLIGGLWAATYTTKQMIDDGYLGVRREAEKVVQMPILPTEDDSNAILAQQALDEWRAVKQQPKAADWAYKWAVALCEIAGAR